MKKTYTPVEAAQEIAAFLRRNYYLDSQKKVYNLNEATSELAKAIQKRIDAFAADLAELRKRETGLVKAVHNIKSEDKDLCPVCGNEDKPNLCKCLEKCGELTIGNKKVSKVEKCGDMTRGDDVTKSEGCLICGQPHIACNCFEALAKNDPQSGTPIEDHITAGANIIRQGITNTEGAIGAALAYGKMHAKQAAQNEDNSTYIPPVPIPPAPEKKTVAPAKPAATPAAATTPDQAAAPAASAPAASATPATPKPKASIPGRKKMRPNRGKNRVTPKGDGSYRGGRGR